MSLLDRGNETVVVFPEETTTDTDGNTVTRPSTTGITARAVIQPLSNPTDDQDATGNITGPGRYRMRLARRDHAAIGLLGRQSAVEWRGERWAIQGDPVHFTGSPKTAHVDYSIGRA